MIGFQIICSKTAYLERVSDHFQIEGIKEAVAQTCSVKKVFLEISQNSQENTCARVSFLIKLPAPPEKETLAQVFSCEFCEILRTPFFTEHLWWLLWALKELRIFLKKFTWNLLLFFTI